MAATSGSGYEKIKVTVTNDGQIVRILMATPPANVLDAQAMTEVMKCLDNEAADPTVKAIVFEGEGKHYCFGASVPEHVKEKAGDMISAFHRLFKKLLATNTITISLVRGQCLGGGMELATFCNFIFAETSAKFGQPEIQLAVLPPVAASILPGIIGQLRADDLILTGRSIDAATAKDWGLVHTVAEAGEGEAALTKFIEKQLLPKSASSLRMANRASRSGWYEWLGEKLDKMEHLYVKELMETNDANEGINAFLEKRKPEYKNN
jgi:cyclohexa-1,5-dienecarbonyl-CoA hydratase